MADIWAQPIDSQRFNIGYIVSQLEQARDSVPSLSGGLLTDEQLTEGILSPKTLNYFNAQQRAIQVGLVADAGQFEGSIGEYGITKVVKVLNNFAKGRPEENNYGELFPRKVPIQ